jgi:hypothetical protein
MKPLPGYDWVECFKNHTLPSLKEMGKLVNDHVREFWSRYNVQIDFHIELKSAFYRGSYLAKANYFLMLYDYAKSTDKKGSPYYK